MSDETGYTEAEKREIQLEAIINALYITYQRSTSGIPFTTPELAFADQLFDHLFNLAEVRDNIDDLCRINIKMEDED